MKRALDGDTRGQVSTIHSVNNSWLFGQDLQSVKSQITHLEYQGKPSVIFFPKILDNLFRSRPFRFYFLFYSSSSNNNKKKFIEYLLCTITVLVAGNLTVTRIDLTYALM